MFASALLRNENHVRAHSRAHTLANAVVAEDDDTECIQILAEKLRDIAPKWSEFGLQLNLLPGTLDAIKTNPDRDPVVKKFQSLLQYWIDDGKEETRTWGFLAEAVKKAGNGQLARQIKDRDDYDKDSKGTP